MAPGRAIGADAEMVFADISTGMVDHVRLTGTTWSTPVVVGGPGLTGVAIGSLSY